MTGPAKKKAKQDSGDKFAKWQSELRPPGDRKLRKFGPRASEFALRDPKFDARINILVGSVRSSKAQPLDAKLLTPSGWKRMGDIRVGDSVITGDGTSTKVEGVFPQGEKEIFRVGFSDGSSTEACAEHLWETWTYDERSAGAGKLAKHDRAGSKPKIRTTAEIKATLVAPHLNVKNHSIRTVGPVRFKTKKTDMDPYVLGALLGDGCFRGKQLSLSSADKEIVDYVAGHIPGCELRHRSDYDYDIVSLQPKAQWGTRTHPCIKYLEAVGLWGCYSYEKHVPPEYLFNSVAVRLGVLRGLMDTDGCANKLGTNFATSSPQLKEDVKFLVQSLGGTVTEGSYLPRFSYKGEQKVGRRIFRLAIRMPIGMSPFKLERKAQRERPSIRQKPVRYIVSVESVGFKPAQCIRVAHPSHLYVTDDFIVTHNTWSLMIKILALCIYPVAGHKVITGQSKASIYNNVLSDLFEVVGERNYSYNRQTGALTLYGQHWLVIGARDEGSEKAIRGMTIGVCVSDELVLMPRSFFMMLLSRMSPAGARMYASTNPDNPFHWVKSELIDDQKRFPQGLGRSLWWQTWTMDDNPNLDEVFKEELKRSYVGVYFRRFILGEWCIASGAIYKDVLSDDIYYDDASRPGPLLSPGGHIEHVVAVDVGTTNPHVYLDLYDDGRTVWQNSEYYFDSHKEGFQKTDAQYADDLVKGYSGWPAFPADPRFWPKVIVDPSAASFRVELINRGVFVVEANNEVLDGIRRTSSFLAQKKLRIHRDCINTRRELEAYSWDEKAALRGEEQPIKSHDHAPDALRYFVQTNIHDWRLSAA